MSFLVFTDLDSVSTFFELLEPTFLLFVVVASSSSSDSDSCWISTYFLDLF